MLPMHDAKDYIVTVDTTTIDGFGDGDAIAITPPSDIVVPKPGAMGDIAVSIKRDPMYTIKIALHQTSPVVAVLRGMWRAGWRDTSQIVKPISVERKSTGETWRGPGFITNDAEHKVAPEVQNTEWTLKVECDSPGVT